MSGFVLDFGALVIPFLFKFLILFLYLVINDLSGFVVKFYHAP
ncbi:putative membrane protein [Helicobacter pylori SouthAfrica50]|uniref:Putative membrane protein n=1 Tax=Helicobacter pylori SouthAfrica50 TaxID=1352357 RepID=T2SBL2_HELPX|nr:putative membrane protein [Helicobacter pylori SouthAfrica50]